MATRLVRRPEDAGQCLEAAMPVAQTPVLPQAWLRCSGPARHARIRLLCLPHAGGGSSAYHRWSRLLPADIELWVACLPGREGRLLERPFDSMSDLLRPLGAAVTAWRDSSPAPYVLLGHSMGALVAFELARALSADGGRGPAGLVVSGHGAPHLPPAEVLHELPDEEFIDRVLSQSGARSDALDDPQLRDLYLPTLRADFRLVERYRHVAAAPLTCPIMTWAGESDLGVPRQEIAQWAGYSSARVLHRVFPGGHSFALDNPGVVLPVLTADLNGIVPA